MSVDKVNALTEEQRERALDVARKRIAGDEPIPPPEPQLKDFRNMSADKYPPIVNLAINVLACVMLCVAFLPSAVRIHALAIAIVALTIRDTASVYWMAICIVMCAEIGQVICSLVAAKASTRKQRIVLWCGAFACTAIALSGNAVANQSHVMLNIFTFLETFLPPILTLITAQVLKEQILNVLEDREAAKREYQRVHADWKRTTEAQRFTWHAAYEGADKHERWMHYAANAIKQALRDANKQSKAALRALSDTDWRMLILRELDAEYWYERAEERERERESEEKTHTLALQAQQMRVQSQSSAASGRRTNELENAVTDNKDGTFTCKCPYCGVSYRKNTERGAKNAVVSHMSGCVVRKQARDMTDTVEHALHPVGYVNGKGN